MDIFKLVGSIFVDTDEANKSIAKTDEKAEGLGKKLVEGVSVAAKWGAGLVAASTAAAGAVFGFADSAAGTADEIDKMSQKIGISTDAYQEWSYVMGQNGMDVEKLSTGMKTLVSQMDMAAGGTTSAQENFDKLGISIYDVSGKLKDQELILNETMHALADMENGTEKSRLATELFGKAGIEMMPMLNQGSEAMDELTQRAHDLGLVMSGDAVTAGVVLGDTIDDIKKSFAMIGTNLGSAVIPIIQKFADLLIDNMPMIQEMFAALAPVMMGVVSAIFPIVTDLAEMILPIILDLIEQLVPVITEITASILPIFVDLLNILLPPLMEIIRVLLPPLISLIQVLLPVLSNTMALLTPILDLFTKLLTPIAQLITLAIEPLISVLVKLTNESLKSMIPAVELLAEVLLGVLMTAFELLKPVIENIKDAFSGLISFITGVFSGDWSKAWNGIVEMFGNIFNGIVSLVKVPINFIINGINGIFSSLGELEVPDWVPGIGGTSFSLPQIPLLAKGGDIVEAGTVMVGEAGPELLSLPAGARVTPLDKIGTEMDYDRMAQSLASVLAEILPSIIPNYEPVDDETLFQRVRKQSAVNATLGRPGLVV